MKKIISICMIIITLAVLYLVFDLTQNDDNSSKKNTHEEVKNTIENNKSKNKDIEKDTKEVSKNKEEVSNDENNLTPKNLSKGLDPSNELQAEACIMQNIGHKCDLNQFNDSVVQKALENLIDAEKIPYNCEDRGSGVANAEEAIQRYIDGEFGSCSPKKLYSADTGKEITDTMNQNKENNLSASECVLGDDLHCLSDFAPYEIQDAIIQGIRDGSFPNTNNFKYEDVPLMEDSNMYGQLLLELNQ